MEITTQRQPLKGAATKASILKRLREAQYARAWAQGCTPHPRGTFAAESFVRHFRACDSYVEIARVTLRTIEGKEAGDAIAATFAGLAERRTANA